MRSMFHVSALANLDPALQALEQKARTVTLRSNQATLVKFSFHKPQIVYLFYPDFDTEAHPALQSSIQINLTPSRPANGITAPPTIPPVLHRKETFVTSDYPRYDTFAWLTKQEEVLGLLDASRGIGFRNAWEQRLQERKLVIHDHYLACPWKRELSQPRLNPKFSGIRRRLPVLPLPNPFVSLWKRVFSPLRPPILTTAVVMVPILSMSSAWA
jgi:hypothetical protein